MHKLLELLRIDQDVVTDERYEKSHEDITSLNHLFSSVLGVSFVSRCLQQIAEVRLVVVQIIKKNITISVCILGL